MQITHTVPEPWRSYLRAAIQEIQSSRDEELRLLGMVHEARERANRRRASLEETIRLIAREAELPDCQYSITQDGSTITGESPDNPAGAARNFSGQEIGGNSMKEKPFVHQTQSRFWSCARSPKGD